MSNFSGFTLVELLVVLSIMAILGVVAFANFGTLREDQALKGAAFDAQSQLRVAQTNATANLKCSEQTALAWRTQFVKVGSEYQVKTFCQYTGGEGPVWFPVKTVTLPSEILIEKIATHDPSCFTPNPTNPTFQPISVTFSLLYGSSGFQALGARRIRGQPREGPPEERRTQIIFDAEQVVDNCFRNGIKLSVLLKNSRTTNQNSVVIDKGGSIYIQ